MAAYFTTATFAFLKDLTENNKREWFHENKDRYEDHVRGPAQRFIMDFGAHLKTLSEHFRSDPRTVGGSMFRIHRDTRFSTESPQTLAFCAARSPNTVSLPAAMYPSE